MGSRPKPNMTTYDYSVIMYRNPTGKDIPLAIAVESENMEASMMGRDIIVAGMSEITSSIIKHLPNTLITQVRKAQKANPSISLIDALSNSNQWSIYLTKRKTVSLQTRDIKQVAFELFLQNVDDTIPMQAPSRPPIEKQYYVPQGSWGKKNTAELLQEAR